MLATIITRAFQALFAACVLGISISAIRWQTIGTAPATTSYGAFAGAFGLLTALIGVAAIWITVIPSLIMAMIDGLASLLLLAGGIAFAVGLRGVHCNRLTDDLAERSTYENALLNGGCEGGHKDITGKTVCASDYAAHELRGHCRAVEADAAFLFLGFIACVAAAALSFLAHRRGGTMKHSAV